MPNMSYRTHDAIIDGWGDDLYIGLLSSAPNPDGTGIVEPSQANGYARQPVTFVESQSAGITTLSNSNALAYGPATGSGWVDVDYFGLFDADDNFLLYGRLRTSRATSPGEGIMIPIGQIQVRLR